MKHFVPCMATAAAALPMPRPRAVISLRADASDPKALIDELNKAFATFKTEHTEQLNALKKGQEDVVKTEKVDRINSAITDLQKAVDKATQDVAAMQVGAGGGKPVDPAKKAHADAFSKWFRKGVEADLRDLEVKAALQTQSDPDGGYVVPDQMEATIDRILSTVSAMRRIARVISISAGVYKKPVNIGGATYGWVGETAARPQTNTPQLSELEFPAMELYANPAATQTLLDDARIDIGQWLGDEISIVFAEAEGAAFISGTGVNQPRGILSYPTVANASYVWGKLGYVTTGVAADINDSTHNGVDAVLDLIYSIKQGYRQNARFLMNRGLQAKVRKLKNATSGDYLWAPPFVNGVQQGQPASLAGYPIEDDDNMPDVGANVFPIAFGDFQRGYLIVDRFGIRVLRDPYTAKPYVLFYTTKRVGAGVQNFEAIKLLKCA